MQTAMPFWFLCRRPLIELMPRCLLYSFAPTPAYTLITLGESHSQQLKLLRKTLAYQSGRLKNIAQTRLQESIGYVASTYAYPYKFP